MWNAVRIARGKHGPKRCGHLRRFLVELKDLRQLAQRSSLAEKVAELKTGHVSGVRALTAVTGGRVRLGSGLLSQPRERRVHTERCAGGQMLRLVRHGDGCPGAPLTSAVGGLLVESSLQGCSAPLSHNSGKVLSALLLGEAHRLKPPTLARRHSSHSPELFYNRRSW